MLPSLMVQLPFHIEAAVKLHVKATLVIFFFYIICSPSKIYFNMYISVFPAITVACLIYLTYHWGVLLTSLTHSNINKSFMYVKWGFKIVKTKSSFVPVLTLWAWALNVPQPHPTQPSTVNQSRLCLTSIRQPTHPDMFAAKIYFSGRNIPHHCKAFHALTRGARHQLACELLGTDTVDAVSQPCLVLCRCVAPHNKDTSGKVWQLLNAVSCYSACG